MGRQRACLLGVLVLLSWSCSSDAASPRARRRAPPQPPATSAAPVTANISTVPLNTSTLPSLTDLRRFFSDTHDRLCLPTAPTIGAVAYRSNNVRDPSTGRTRLALDVNCSVSATFVQLDGRASAAGSSGGGAVLRTFTDAATVRWSSDNAIAAPYNMPPVPYNGTIAVVSDYSTTDGSFESSFFSKNSSSNDGAVRRGAVSAVDAAGTQLVWASIILWGAAGAPYPISGWGATLLVRHIDIATTRARTVLSVAVTGQWLASLGYLNPARASDVTPTAPLKWAADGLIDMLFVPGSGADASDSVLLLTRHTGAFGFVTPLALHVDLGSGNCAAVPLGPGAPALSAAFDDLSPPPHPSSTSTATSSSDTGLMEQAAYLLYADNAPVSAAACDARGADGILDSGVPDANLDSISAVCYPHYVVRDQPQLPQPPPQFVLPFEFTQKYPVRSSPIYSSDISGPEESENTRVLALNRRYNGSSNGRSSSGAATAPVQMYVADRDRCQVRRVDPVTGDSAVVAGYDGSSSGGSSSGGGLQRRSFLCSLIKARDGPALGQPMGRPSRLARGSPGTLFVAEEWQEFYGGKKLRIRRIVGV